MTDSRARRGRTQANVKREVKVSEKAGSTQTLEMAVGLHTAGEVARAAGLYEQIIDSHPGHADALHFLGLARFQLGDPGRGAALIRRAIEQNPQVGPYHDNLGTVLEACGELDEALCAYREAARIQGDDADRSFNMGVVLHKLDRREEAESAYRTAIRLRPEDGEFHYNLGNLLKICGRLEEAVTAYRDAVHHNPDAAHAWNNLGNTLQLLGRAQQAVDAYREALRQRPEDALTQMNLGNVLRGQEQLEAAVEAYQKAVSLDDTFIGAQVALADVLRLLGRFGEALDAYQGVLKRDPGSSEARIGLASLTRFVLPDHYRPELVSCIEICMQAAEVQPQDLAVTAANQLRLKHGLDSSGGDVDDVIERLAGDRLALQLLTRTINVDPELEKVLVRVRRQLLMEGMAGPPDSPQCWQLAAAIAIQCLVNEYVYPSRGEEDEAVEQLRRALEGGIDAGQSIDRAFQWKLTLLAMYVAPHCLDCAAILGRIEREARNSVTRPLMERTLLEPLEELALEAEITSVGEIEDTVSVAVRTQYEENPYPRWFGLPKRKPVSYRDYLTRRYRHFSPPSFLHEGVQVLAAGCGTGQEAAAIALARSGCEVVGLDLSRRSLAYGLRMARKLGVGNVQFIQGDILSLERLERRFHVIECAGVLHHMADPLAGWRALSECLLPGGLMKIGLYSARARNEVMLARQQIAAEDLSPVTEDIRSFRSRVLRAAPDDPLRRLADSEDLYSMSGCRDLLFHVQEHCFTIPDVAGALAELGLRFIGFEPDMPSVLQSYRRSNPDDKAMTDLEAWNRFEAENPATFAALYVFWCQKPAT